MLHALGFAAADDEGAGAGINPAVFWVWRGGALPDAADLELLASLRDWLAKRASGGASNNASVPLLERFRSGYIT